MSDGLPDITVLAEDLDAAGRRRLWLIQRIIERCSIGEIEAALATAIRIEAFIAGSHSCTNGSRNTARAPGPSAHPAVAPGNAGSSQNARAAQGVIMPRGSEAENGHRAGRPLLDADMRERFIREAARNPDNRHLAQIFGLSVRQAHAIRVGLSKTIAQARGAVPRRELKSKRPSAFISAEAELRKQEEFLRTRPATPPTIDDVVRYLRQAGDVVVPNDGTYLVNYRMKLTSEELLDRANKRRCERTQEPFVLTTSTQAQASAG